MKYAFLIVIGLVFWSCFNEGDCLVTATNNMYVQFKRTSDHTLDTALAVDSILISGASRTGYWKLPHDTLITGIVLPVDINNNTTTFIIHRKSIVDTTVTATDTLQVGYRGQSRVISRDCGAFMYYSDLKILKTNIDSVRIKKLSTSLVKDPTSSAYAVNYQIFY